MDVLVEVHDGAELDRALRLTPISSASTTATSRRWRSTLATTEALAPRVPADRLLVAESGLYGHADLERMAGRGRAFLVGESLMREADVTGHPAAARPGGAGLSGLTHIDAQGNAVMVDVGDKAETARTATAEGRIRMPAETLAADRRGLGQEGRRADRRPARRDHGGQAHARPDPALPPLALTSVKVLLEPEPDPPGIRITATCKLAGRTGVEMEALTAVSVAALTVYDMVKAIDRGMVIEGIRLVHKAGGRSGDYHAD
jgi:cyclic pyranopterin monophosphate synthase